MLTTERGRQWKHTSSWDINCFFGESCKMIFPETSCFFSLGDELRRVTNGPVSVPPFLSFSELGGVEKNWIFILVRSQNQLHFSTWCGETVRSVFRLTNDELIISVTPLKTHCMGRFSPHRPVFKLLFSQNLFMVSGMWCPVTVCSLAFVYSEESNVRFFNWNLILTDVRTQWPLRTHTVSWLLSLGRGLASPQTMVLSKILEKSEIRAQFFSPLQMRFLPTLELFPSTIQRCKGPSRIFCALVGGKCSNAF